MPRIEIGAGFVVTALSGFHLLDSFAASLVLLALGLLLIGHGAYEIVKPSLFLKRTVAHWFGQRHWVVKYLEGYPGMYFAMEIRNQDHRDWPILVARSKDTKGVITFSAVLPLEPMAQHLPRLSPQQQQLLIFELRKTLEIMGVGFAPLRWPLENTTLQTGISAFGGVSEHTVDMGARNLLNALLACRATIQQAIIRLAGDTPTDSPLVV